MYRRIFALQTLESYRQASKESGRWVTTLPESIESSLPTDPVTDAPFEVDAKTIFANYIVYTITVAEVPDVQPRRDVNAVVAELFP